MNLDDRLEETEFLYFEHPEHNPQSIKDLVEDMVSNFDRNQDKVKLRTPYLYLPPPPKKKNIGLPCSRFRGDREDRRLP